MKVNRVILSSNYNPTYYEFWNPLSKVYHDKFGIRATLIWFGAYQEAKEAGISREYGDVIYVQPNEKYHTPWQTTWGLFWATQFFLEDTCLIIGIDQVPLSGMFIFDMIKDLPEDAYALLIADAYGSMWDKGASPSSYHIAKGSTFVKIYDFDANFALEAEKVYNSGIDALWENTEGKWGIDETYSCHKLRQSGANIHGFSNFRLLEQKRIECCRNQEPTYDIERLKNHDYSEAHLCRPFSNHSQYIQQLYDSIPDCR